MKSYTAWLQSDERRASLHHEVAGAAHTPEPQPVAWRVRGYNQFKTGTPSEWRYVTGAERPKVNNPEDCDFEPLYASGVSVARGEVQRMGGTDGAPAEGEK